jgi:hypothetical protein
MSDHPVATIGPSRFWTRFALMALAGVTIAAVEAAAFVVAALEYLDAREGAGAPPVLLVVLWLLVVLTPVAWGWSSGGRRVRWFGVGAAASLLIQLTYFLALALAGTGTACTAGTPADEPDRGLTLTDRPDDVHVMRTGGNVIRSGRSGDQNV